MRETYGDDWIAQEEGWMNDVSSLTSLTLHFAYAGENHERMDSRPRLEVGVAEAEAV